MQKFGQRTLNGSGRPKFHGRLFGNDDARHHPETEREDPSWATQEGRLPIPASNLDLISGDVDGYFVRGVGIGLTHTENLLIRINKIFRKNYYYYS